MFKETDYYDRKMNIWDCDKKIDLENLRHRISDTQTRLIPLSNFINPCEAYYFYRNFNIKLFVFIFLSL